MLKFISWDFWTAMRPGSLLPIYRYTLAVLVGVFICAAIIFWLKRKNKKMNLKLSESWQSFFSTNAFIALLLLFFNYELVPFFSSRFWYLLWFFGMLLWLYFICKQIKKIPEKRKLEEAKKEYNKYLP